MRPVPFSKWVISSAVERLVYTERVGGSIPSSPTIFLIIFLLVFPGCGRKGDLTPDSLETGGKDSYPKQYPIYKEQVVR